MRDAIKRWVERLLSRQPVLYSTACKAYYRLDRSFCTLSPGAPSAILDALERAKAFRGLNIGDYFEFGLFRGYTLWSAFNACRKLGLEKTRLHGFDSFRGLPAVRGIDQATGKFFAGQFNCSKAEVVANLDTHVVDWSRVSLIEGFFDETLTPALKEQRGFGTVAVAFIDCDLYASTRPVLDWLSSNLIDGSILLFDDWYTFGNDESLGQQRAFAEFCAAHPRFEPVPFNEFEEHGKGFILRQH
jgi:O-methyltransferase